MIGLVLLLVIHYHGDPSLLCGDRQRVIEPASALQTTGRGR